MSQDGQGERPSKAGMLLRDGRMMNVDERGLHVGETVYSLDQIQDARIVSPEPATIGLRVASVGLVTLMPVRSEDAHAALDRLFQMRPALRPAGYGDAAQGQPASPPLSYLPPPLYGTPPGYMPPAGHSLVMGGPPPGGQEYYPTPGAGYMPAYGPPPAFPGYPVVPPMGGAPGSPMNEGGIGIWPQGIGEVIGTSFRLYFKRFGRFVALGLIVGIWPALLAGALQAGLLYAEGFNPLEGTLTQQSPFGGPGATNLNNVPLFQWLLHPTATQIGMMVGGSLLWLVLTLTLSAWSVGALALGARDAIAGRPVRISAAVSGGLSRMPAVLGVELLQVLMGLALVVLLVVPFIVLEVFVLRGSLSSLGSNAQPNGSAVGAVFGTFCGFFVLVALVSVGYTYLIYRVYLAQFAAAADRLSPLRAWGKSWSLTWRNWWRTFLPLLVVAVVVAIVAAVGGMFQYFSIIAGSLIVLPLVTAIVQPLTVLTALVVYYDLRLRREGYPALAMELGLPGLQPPPAPYAQSPSAGSPTGPAQPDHPMMG